MSKFRNAAAAVIVLGSAAVCGCATRPAIQEPDVRPAVTEESNGAGAVGAVAKGAGKGLLMGGAACLMPAAIGARVGGPIGLIVGGVVTVYCLPVGLTAGALIGAGVGAAKHAETSAGAGHASQTPAAQDEPQALVAEDL